MINYTMITCAFLVYEASKMRMVDMMRAGFGLNLLTMLVIVANNYALGNLMFGVNEGLPDWVKVFFY